MAQLCLNNNCYNTVHQLTKSLEFLSHVDRYIDDAKSAGDGEAEKVWNTIKTDREKHADLLKGLVTNEVKSGKF